MKIRAGFVSNSSSSSFLMGIRYKDEKEHFFNLLSNKPTPPDRTVIADIVKKANTNWAMDDTIMVDLIDTSSVEITPENILDYFDPEANSDTIDLIRDNGGMIFYYVSISDEFGYPGAEGRGLVPDFGGLKTKDYLTIYLND